MGPAFVCLRKYSPPRLSANSAERVLCLDRTSVSGLPKISSCGETSDNHLVQGRHCTLNARNFRTWILRAMCLRAPICSRALSCNRLPTFMPFSSLRCCLCVPSLSSLLAFNLSLTCLSNGTTHEAPCQTVFSSLLLPPPCFVQTLCSALCSISLSDLCSDLSLLRRSRHKALRAS